MVLSMDRWSGKVAIVTGASSGIGAAIASNLVEKGLIVVGVARRPKLVQELAEKLSGKKGKLHAYEADITKDEEVLKLFKWTQDNLGLVHVLVNSAGLAVYDTLTEGKTEDWKAIFDVHVLGLCIITREAVKAMKQNKINGHVIHLNAVLGHQVDNIPNMNVYPASKFAVTALTETLRQELNSLGLKIKVTSVSPGLVATQRSTFNEDLTQDRKEYYETLASLKAEDVADAVVYALSTAEHVQVHEIMLRALG